MSELIGELILMRWDALTIGGGGETGGEQGGKQGEMGGNKGGSLQFERVPTMCRTSLGITITTYLLTTPPIPPIVYKGSQSVTEITEINHF